MAWNWERLNRAGILVTLACGLVTFLPILWATRRLLMGGITAQVPVWIFGVSIIMALGGGWFLRALTVRGTTPALAGVAHRPGTWIAFVTGAGLAAASAFLPDGEQKRNSDAHVVPIAATRGTYMQPSFSPDGTQIAFVSDGPAGDNLDIYTIDIKAQQEPKRLTVDPAPDNNPTWAPNGEWIAFTRLSSGKTGIYIVRPTGGPETKIDEFDVTDGITWSHDSKALVLAIKEGSARSYTIYRLDVATRVRQQLTKPPTGSLGDSCPRVSPDGKWLAFARSIQTLEGNVFVEALDADQSENPPIAITNAKSQPIGEIAWKNDSETLIYSRATTGNLLVAGTIWETNIKDPSRAHRLPDLNEVGLHFDYSRSSGELVFERPSIDWDIASVQLSAGAGEQHKRSPISSTAMDNNPRYSPDGSRIAFESMRSGYTEIWVCDNAGTKCWQLTTYQSHSGTPRWSPDGSWIVFDSKQSGNWDIYKVPATGGYPQQLTTDEADDARPFWSPNGQFIYFTSSRSGNAEIWRMTPDGREQRRLTSEGAYLGMTSPNDKILYYTKELLGHYELWKRDLNGQGTDERLLQNVHPRNFDVTKDGVYFQSPTDSRIGNELRYLDLGSHHIRRVATIRQGVTLGFPLAPEGLSVAPTGKDLLFVWSETYGYNLFLYDQVTKQ